MMLASIAIMEAGVERWLSRSLTATSP